MKNFILPALILFCNLLFGQFGYIRGGYSGNSLGLKGLNYFVENYNDSRPWLEKEMKNFGYLNGYNVGVGVAVTKLFADFNLNFCSQTNSAQGRPTGTLLTRELKLKNNRIDVTLGRPIISDNFFLAAGLMTQLGLMNVLTRLNEDGAPKSEWDIADVNFSPRIGPAIMVCLGPPNINFMINMHYCFGLSKLSVGEVDEAINQTFYNSDYPKQFRISDNSFGFNVSLVLFVGTK